MTTLLNYTALRLFSVYTTAVHVQGYSTIGDGGEGTFYWDKNSSEPDNDGTVIRHKGSNPPARGAWKRFIGDAINVRWFGAKNDGSTNSAVQIKNAVNAAIHIHAKVKFFSGTYKFDEGIEIDIPDNFHLIIEGDGALIKATSLVTDRLSEVNLIRFFTSAGADTKGTGVFIDSLNFDGAVLNPQFTEPNINAIKRIHAIVSVDIFTVSIKHCHFKNIQGSGIRACNFVCVNFENLAFNNVGGKFHLENDFDSFGDGIYMCQTNLETSRPTRKFSHAAIADCQIFAYDPLTNGNFASRCGVCIEGFGTIKSDHRVYLKISNCTISGYDRTFHVEGIDAKVTADSLNIKNFQSIYLLTSGRSKSSFNNCSMINRLPDNPNQVKLGNGGVMTYSSDLPNHIVFNQCQIKVNAAAIFIGQLEFIDTVFDYSNHDILFENSTIVVSRSKFINIPHNLSRGLNFYSCTFSASNSTIQGAKNGNDNSGGVLHFENLDLPFFENNTIIDTRLIFTFRPSASPAQVLNNKIYRNPKGTGARMDALINYNNIPQVKMSNNQFYIAVATATDEEPIYQTYGVQRVAHNNDRKQLHVIDTSKTLNVAL